jgi:hypothetical protein
VRRLCVRQTLNKVHKGSKGFFASDVPTFADCIVYGRLRCFAVSDELKSSCSLCLLFADSLCSMDAVRPGNATVCQIRTDPL